MKKYVITWSKQWDGFQLEEYPGDAPVKYECTAQFCWRDCVPCEYCEASEMVILDKKEYDEWKKRRNNQEIIPCSKDDYDFWVHHRNFIGKIDKNQFGIKDGIAHPIQTTLWPEKELNKLKVSV